MSEPRISRHPIFLLAFLLVNSAWSSKEPIREFHEPLDRFEFRYVEPKKAILTCRFEKNRTHVRPFVLALEEDNKVVHRFLGGRILAGTQDRVLSASDALETAEWIRIDRLWLSDIPLAALRFPKVDATRFLNRLPVSATAAALAPQVPEHARGPLVEATFELVFSQSHASPDRPMEFLNNRDVFGQIAAHLVSNPTDIPTVRGVTEEAPLEDPVRIVESRGPLARMETTEDGLYCVSPRDLEAIGFPLSNVPLDQLTLSHRGQAVPLGILPATQSENGSAPPFAGIWFWADAQSNGQFDKNVYELAWGHGNGPRIETKATLTELFPDLDGRDENRDWDFSEIHLEENEPSLYSIIPGVSGALDVYWREFRSGGERLKVDFDAEELDISAVSETQGATSVLGIRTVPSESAHGEGSISVGLNGAEVGSASVSVNSPDVIRLPFRSALLRSRGNHIEVRFEGKLRAGKARHWGIFIDWLHLTYPARASLGDGPVASLRPDSLAAPLNPTAQRVRWHDANPSGDWWITTRSPNPGGWAKCLRLRSGDGNILGPSRATTPQWRMVDLGKARKPTLRLADGHPVLRRTDLQADVLVVADLRFVETLEAYLERRRRDGWSCLVTTPEQIYGEFSHGIKDVHAIREFCRHAYRRYRKPRPQVLWLVGEARLDGRNLLGSRVEDLVPSPVEREREVAHCQDQWYGELVGDDSLPDLLVSRVSVDDVTELSHYLAKVIHDEDHPDFGWWRARGLFLADDGFGGYAEELLRDGMGQALDPRIIRMEDFPRSPNRKFEAIGKVGQETRGIREEVVKRWSEGARLLEYSGHGGIIVWSHEALFKGLNRPDSDVLRLHNEGRYSHVFIKSCLSASVNWPTFPGEVSVAEALIKAPRRGAISVLGSAGTEYARDQDRFGTKLLAGLWNHRIDLISAARVYAHAQFELQSPARAGVARQFVLHGDPLLRFDVPRPLDLEVFTWGDGSEGPTATLRWDSSVRDGTAEIRFRARGLELFSLTVPNPPSGKPVGPFSVPPDLPFRPDLQVAVYVWNPDQRLDAYGSRAVPPFPTQGREWPRLYADWVKGADAGEVTFGELRFLPHAPSVGDEIELEMEAANRGIQVRMISSIEARSGADLKHMERVGALSGRALTDPGPLFPGEVRTYRWILPAPKERGPLHVHIRAGLDGEECEKTGSVDIVQPPEVTLLSLDAEDKRTASPVDAPLKFVLKAKNIGDSTSESLDVFFRDALTGVQAQARIPELGNAQVADITFQTSSPQHRFVWETQMEPLPTATTSRTRWRQQSFVLEVARSEGIAKIPWTREYDRLESFDPFRIRNFERGDLFPRVSPDIRFKDLPVMELDFPDTSEIRSATHAGAAAWQYQHGWWVSPQQLQAHPAWNGVPLRAILPWRGEPSLALIAPTYYKDDNYQGLGFPMPAITFEGARMSFELTPANSSVDGSFPSTLIELAAPGLEWTLRKRAGAWPGFSGFRMALVPEICSPVFNLPERGAYQVRMSAEWVPQAPTEIHYEARGGLGEKEWLSWEPMGESGLRLEGDRIQFRCWLSPDESTRDLIIRSLRLQVLKATD